LKEKLLNSRAGIVAAAMQSASWLPGAGAASPWVAVEAERTANVVTAMVSTALRFEKKVKKEVSGCRRLSDVLVVYSFPQHSLAGPQGVPQSEPTGHRYEVRELVSRHFPGAATRAQLNSDHGAQLA
jgi:hypothetical protein